jgi:hypothetical protein
MQPDAHHPQFFVSELQQDKDQVRSYKSEFRADAIGILGFEPPTRPARQRLPEKEFHRKGSMKPRRGMCGV